MSESMGTVIIAEEERDGKVPFVAEIDRVGVGHDDVKGNCERGFPLGGK